MIVFRFVNFTKVILKTFGIIFLFVKCKSLFFKVANDQRPDHSLFGQFRHDKYIYIYNNKAFKLVLNEIKPIDTKTLSL